MMRRAALLACVAMPLAVAAQDKPKDKEMPVTELIDLVGCTLCHQVDNRILGPSFKEVAVKYRNDKEALPRVAERIQKGSKGIWGEVAMPPNNVKPEEAKRIAEWVLAR
ncbi:MAG: cytochrome C' [Betaproteobacteria bacterium]|nr:cytochrome C' [Betaproteobacteria bacterium]